MHNDQQQLQHSASGGKRKYNYDDDDRDNIDSFDPESDCICRWKKGDNPMCREHNHATFEPVGVQASSASSSPFANPAAGYDHFMAATPSSSTFSDMSDLSTSLDSGRMKRGTMMHRSSINNSDMTTPTIPKKKKKCRSVCSSVDSMLLAATNNEIKEILPDDRGDLKPHDDDYILMRPEASKTAGCWKHFMIYDTNEHKEKKDIAKCSLCGTDISFRGPSTSGMNKHLKFLHSEEWQELQKSNGKFFDCASSQKSIRHFLVKDDKKTPAELKTDLIRTVTNWVIAKCLPFTIVECQFFRAMFCPFHKDAHLITSISADRVREEIFKLGSLAEKVTTIEVAAYKGSWTNDHWTGKDDATYSTTTFHYIKNWKLCNIVVDFKVFKGTTTGKAIYNDQLQVLEACTAKENIVMGITDTTVSMGVLGQFLRTNNMHHAYCTDHNLQCNAVLAFQGKACNI